MVGQEQPQAADRQHRQLNDAASMGSTRLLLAGALVLLTPWIAGQLPGSDPARLTRLLWAYGAAGLPYLYLLCRWRRAPNTAAFLKAAVLIALAGRLLLLTLPPLLSEDLWRYIWDGAAHWAGVNPYRYAPIEAGADVIESSAALAYVRAQIGHAQIPTIYPPAAQLAFAAITRLSTSPVAMRLLMLIADVGVGVMLWRWCAQSGRAPQVALLYLFAPITAMETAVGGHVDVLGVLGTVAGAFLLGQGKQLRAGALLAVGVGVKLLPLMALPMLVWRRRRAATGLLMVSGLLFGAYHMGREDTGRGLAAYGHRWQANEGLFGVMQSGFEYIWPEEAGGSIPHPWVRKGVRALVGPPVERGDLRIFPDEWTFAAAKASALSLLGLACLWALFRRRNFEGYFSTAVMALLLVSPVVHPWYLLWLLPFALFALAGQPDTARLPRWPWAVICWTLLSFLAYLPRPGYLETGAWVDPVWVRWVEYTPVWLLLLLAGWGLRQQQELDVALGAGDARPDDAEGRQA